ncbi:MAG: LysM peptidoglycan-binding domain-containing protein [Firmicutes bacterium]|nr:LysM peptidoglycan-binding domain-containing protein [Bacillota bacterium]
MDIYIKEKSGVREIQIPWLPDKISFSSGGTQFATHNILDLGDLKVPNGSGLREFSWTSIFPGENHADLPFLKGDWIDPKEYQIIFSTWQRYGTPLRLIVTETTINHDVYLSDYSFDYSGGYGDFEYTVKFTDNRQVNISSSGGEQSTPAKTTVERSVEKTPSTYTVKSGDCLWNIAKKHLGNGADYMKIYNLNTDILKNPNTIKPGQVLKLP